MKPIKIQLTTHRQLAEKVKTLYADPYVKDRKGIFEYVLGGMIDKKLLDVRVFDEATKSDLCNTNRQC